MAKASDILNKSGSGGRSPLAATPPQIPLNTESKKAVKEESIAAHRPDKGTSLHKPGKAQGGAGGSSSGVVAAEGAACP